MANLIFESPLDKFCVGQAVQQCLRILQVCCIKALSEPPIDRCQKIMGFLAFALLLPESSEAGGSS